MSDDSNNPNPNISIEEFISPHISVDENAGKIHLTFGKSPREQISVDINGVANDGTYHFQVGLISAKFPMGKVSIQ